MIICCGEALIDMLPRTSTEGEATFAPFPGGAVFNTAIALGRLGAPAGFVSGLGRDLFGSMLRQSLADSHVDASQSISSDRPTTLAFVTLNDGQASYAFYDENTAGRMISPGDMPTFSNKVEALFFGGISLVVEPCADAYRRLCLREAGDRIIMIDPNVRPSFIKDEDGYRARLQDMLAVSDILKISDEDLAWWAPGQNSDDFAADQIAAGRHIVIVTEGSKGARAYSRAETVHVPAKLGAVVDTVGAGDTFNAGVLAALHLHDCLTQEALASLNADTLRAALTLGVRAAAVTVSRAGANPPWSNEL